MPRTERNRGISGNRSKKGLQPKSPKKVTPVKASSPRKAGKKRSHEFALTMREKISESWVELKRKIL